MPCLSIDGEVKGFVWAALSTAGGVSFGSCLSVRYVVRFGSSLSTSGAAHVLAGYASVIGHAIFSISLSVRNSGVAGKILSAHGAAFAGTGGLS